jgi:phosphotransacetylase
MRLLNTFRWITFGGMMLRAGDVDAMLAGVAHPTARVIEAEMADAMTTGLQQPR